MIEFRVLGTLEVVEQDRPLALGPPKQRALLAVLLVHRGEPVSSDRLIDELWGEQAPASAVKLVQGYVSSLRKVLGDGLLVTHGRGYMLQAKTGQTDADRFASLVNEGRRALQDGDARTAAARLREALALWRGPALADFEYASFAHPEIVRLEEARLAALEERIDAELALGEHRRLVGELEALAHEHPLRERFIAQLMLALYRSGRQADALETYRIGRRRLVDELGLEPGRELQELEQAILAQDPALGPPVRGTRRGLGTTDARRRRGGLLIGAGGVLLLVVLIGVALSLAGSGASTVRVAPDSLAEIDIQTNRVAGAVPVGTRPGGVAFGFGSLWVANVDDQNVSRVDPTTLHTIRAIPVGDPPTGVAASDNAIWVAASDLSPFASTVSVSRVDPEFNVPGPALHLRNVVPNGQAEVAAQGNAVWAAPSTGLLTQLDPTSGRVVGHFDPNASPSGIAVGAGAVWISDNEADNVTRVDPSGLLTPIAVGNGPSGIAVGEDAVWVADSLDDAVVRIDPIANAVTAKIPVGRSPAGVAIGDGSVWVANSGDGTVSRIDPRTDKVAATIAVGGSPQAITVADGRAWVTVDARSIAPSGAATSGGTLRIESTAEVGSLDPALVNNGLEEQVLQATCARLVNFADEPGPAGSLPTPEVAQALPALSGDGKTYTFTIRPGFRFSPPMSEPVTAQTFKDSIERAFNPKIKGWSVDFNDIAGVSAYEAGKAAHISGIVARGDTLTFHLVSPNPDFLARLTEPPTCAVPSGTPVNPNEVRVIPSAGPYYVQSYTPGQSVVLVRNPNYYGRRPRDFERIQLTLGVPAGRAVADVQAGRADYTTLAFGAPSASSGLPAGLAAEAARLAARYGPGSAAAARGRQQYFVSPIMQLDYFVLNTHRPLFSDVRLRQAVNYAIDRRALADLGDGFVPLPEHPTDHYLPPGMPGYRNEHVYPLTPDLSKARQLASANGRTAVLYTCDVSPCREQAQIVKDDLAEIGLRVEIRTFPFATLFPSLINPGEPFDLAWTGWITDFPDPYGMLNSLLENGLLAEPTFTDPTFQRKLVAAARLSGSQRYVTYGNLDLDLARNGAPLVAFGNLSSHDFFSARIGCQTFNGIWGMDLAALCLRPTRG